MGFKKVFSISFLPVLLLGFLFIVLMIWKFSSKAELPVLENDEVQKSAQDGPIKENIAKVPIPNPVTMSQKTMESMSVTNIEDDAAIQEQLDHDRLQQKQIKDLRIKLEQTNLELEQEKAFAEINKLKKENRGAFNEPNVDGQNNSLEIKVDYIGGDSVKKDAILSIGGISYQVKVKSNPIANVQVVSISDSSVTLHFSAPQALTKTIDYKPE
jgi:hypothetical protein